MKTISHYSSLCTTVALALAINCGALLFARNATAAAQVVGLWRFNEGSGTNIYDSSGFGNNGYLVGENGNYPGWVAGQTNFGNCLYFTNDTVDRAYVEIPGSASLMIGPTATSPWSITAWAYETSDGSGNFVADYGRIFTGDAGQSFMWMSGAAGDAQMYTWHGNIGVWDVGWGSGSSVAPVLDTWVHWALVYDGTNLTVYRNGNQGPLGGIATQPFDAPLAWSGYTGELQIGSETRTSANRNWNGMLDDMAVFSGALTAADVQKVMQGNFTNFLGGAPSIAAQPKNRVIRNGLDVTFSVTAGGTPPLFYQWYFNTNTLPPQGTNSTLVLTNVQANQAGSYSVVISNALGGTATSQFAFLTVTTNPPIVVGLWRFDEGSGTNASDSSGLGNNGYLVGENGNYPGWVAGQSGFSSALYFTNDGSDHAYVNIPGSSALQIGAAASNTWTMAYWAYEDSDGTGYPLTQYGRFLSQEGGRGLLPETGKYGDYQIYEWSGSVSAWDIGFGTSSSVAPLLDTWVHWAWVYDGYGLTLYRNGNQGAQGGKRTVSVTAALAFTGYTGSIQIGSDLSALATKNWNGMLDDVVIFRGALSQAEIAAVMAGNFSAYTNQPASIIAQPQSATVVAGHDINFSVTVAGQAPFAYQWYYNVTNLMVGATNSTVILTNVQPDQAGSYSVTISNLGVVSSGLAQLTVRVQQPFVVGLWRFDEGSGTNVSDSTGLGNNGYLFGDNGNLPTWVTGQSGFGDALSFRNDGVDRCLVSIPGSPSLKIGQTAADTWSWTAWAYESSGGGGNFVAYYGRIFTMQDGGSFGLQLESGTVGDAEMNTWSQRNSAWIVSWGTNSSVTPVLDQWVHWAMVYDGNYLTLYRNGNQGLLGGKASVPVQAALGFSGYAGATQLGGQLNPSANRNWNGMLDDEAVFNGPLTEAQVRTVMSGDFSAFVQPPLEVTLSLGNVVLSWPALATGFQLQRSPNLSMPEPWINVTNAPVLQGAMFQVTLPANAQAQFFRLIK